MIHTIHNDLHTLEELWIKKIKSFEIICSYIMWLQIKRFPLKEKFEEVCAA